MKQYDLDDDLFQGNNKLERLYHGVIEEIGEDPTRQGLLKTPYHKVIHKKLMKLSMVPFLMKNLMIW